MKKLFEMPELLVLNLNIEEVTRDNNTLSGLDTDA